MCFLPAVGSSLWLKRITHLLFISQNVVTSPLLFPPLQAHVLIYSFAVISASFGRGAEITMCVKSVTLDQEEYPHALESEISH